MLVSGIDMRSRGAKAHGDAMSAQDLLETGWVSTPAAIGADGNWKAGLPLACMANFDVPGLVKVLWDRQGRLRRWSLGAREYFGWDAEDVLDRPVAALPFLGPREQRTLRRALLDVTASRSDRIKIALSHRAKDGTLLACWWSNYAMADSDRKVVLVLSYVHTAERLL